MLLFRFHLSQFGAGEPGAQPVVFRTVPLGDGCQFAAQYVRIVVDGHGRGDVVAVRAGIPVVGAGHAFRQSGGPVRPAVHVFAHAGRLCVPSAGFPFQSVPHQSAAASSSWSSLAACPRRMGIHVSAFPLIRSDIQPNTPNGWMPGPLSSRNVGFLHSR